MTDPAFIFGYGPWTDLAPHQQEAFERLIREGAEVSGRTLPGLLKRAYCLGHAEAPDGHLIATAALKTPNATYPPKVFEKSGTTLCSADYPLELGWIFTRPQARGKGIASALVAGLVQRCSQNVFATSADDEDHTSVHRMLERNGFAATGTPYLGNSGRMLKLFVRNKR